MINDETTQKLRREMVFQAIDSGEIMPTDKYLVFGLLHVMENDGQLAEMVGNYGDQNRDKPEILAIFDRASTWLLKHQQELKLEI